MQATPASLSKYYQKKKSKFKKVSERYLNTKQQQSRMEEPVFIKTFAVILIIITIINFLLMIFRKISLKAFWMTIIVLAAITYIAIPKLKKIT